MIYPWQQSLWDAVVTRPLPAALLLAGREGIGKLAFARALARRVLCEVSTGCGQCQSCRWFDTGTHPTWYVLEPEDEEAEASKKKARVIKVEQVRALKERTAIASPGFRVLLIHPAEAMNANAQNALLKILEEPPRSTLFILVAHQPQRLLPTIHSRCQRLNMPTPRQEAGVAWLRKEGVAQPENVIAAACGAPLRALAIASQHEARTLFMQQLSKCPDPFSLAKTMQEFEAPQVVHWLQQWAYDLMLYQSQAKVRYNIEFEKQLSDIASPVRAKAVHTLQRQLLAAAAVAEHALNPALFMEELSFSYWRLATNND